MKIGKKFKVVASKLLAVALIGSTVVGAASPVFAEGTYTRSITITNQFDNGGAKDGITGGKYTITPYKVTKSDNKVSTEQADLKAFLDNFKADSSKGITKDDKSIILDFKDKSTMTLELYKRTPTDTDEYAFRIEQTEAVPGFKKNTEKGIKVDFPTRGTDGKYQLKDETIGVNFKNTINAGDNNKIIEFTKKSSAGKSVVGTEFKLTRINGNEEIDKNIEKYYGKPLEIIATVGENGIAKFTGAVPGKYKITEEKVDSEGNHFLRVGSENEGLATITVSNSDDEAKNLLPKIDKNICFTLKQGIKVFDTNAILTNYARPGHDTDTKTKDGAFNKTLYAVNGKEIGNKAAKDITVRKGDKLEWKLSVNIPDNIKDFKKFGISDSVGEGLEFKDPKKANEEQVATNFVKELTSEGKSTLFTNIRFEREGKDLVFEIPSPKDVTETGEVNFIVTTYVKDDITSNDKVNNIMRVLYKTDDVTSGYGEGDKYDPGKSDKNDIYDTGDNSPKSDSQSQLIVKTDDKQSTITILSEDRKEEFKSEEPKVITDINNLPDGKHIVEIITAEGSDKEGYRPVKSEIEIEITNGEVTKVDGQPTNNFTDKNGITWDNNTNTLGIKMLDADTWTPGTGTLTVIPLLGLAGAAAIVGKVARKKENDNEEE